MSAWRSWWRANVWYGKSSLVVWMLLPFSLLFFLLTFLRKLYYKWTAPQKLPALVVVVGGIVVGGNGKTPMVMWLATRLKERGISVGVVSRGVGTCLPTNAFPHRVGAKDRSCEVGEEAKLIAKTCEVPVVIDGKRYRAARYLLATEPVQVILSDDGLQHYALPREIEFALVDAKAPTGNGYLLPAGPLREYPSRLKEVDAIILKNSGIEQMDHIGKNEYQAVVEPKYWRNLYTKATVPVGFFEDQQTTAVCGIGNPQSFFDTLDQIDINYEAMIFDDHHVYSPKDRFFSGVGPVLMTEKDAVKCEEILDNVPNNSRFWCIKISLSFASADEEKLMDMIVSRMHLKTPDGDVRSE